MKQWKWLLATGLLMIIAAGCSNEALDASDINVSDYEQTLESASGGEETVFTDDRADVYFYFTGVD
ncbi:hypothetical protein [Alkalicoccus chagannorensis]|uniref:hypothetical protein n=1 Tax=Alkalicoccus chagannorensis TaxID=427072 RepID=UPI000421084E|nr:hypothetical protein [Alkalicoccus chagannorensis]